MDMDNFPFLGLIPNSILRQESIRGTWHMHCRKHHGLIVKIQGKTQYRFEHQTLQLCAGEVLFVEKGLSYSIQEIMPGYSYIINFDSCCPIKKKTEKLPLPQNPDIRPIAEKMYYRWQQSDLYGTLSCLYSILEKTTATKEYASSREKQLLVPVIEYLNTNLTDPNLTLSVLPALVGVSEVYLRRIFKKYFGFTPTDFVTHHRIQLAKQLLADCYTKTISEIAAQTGYNDPLYFSRVFKKQTGLSPSKYIQMCKEESF